MSIPDPVFGPPLIQGEWRCPDCNAGPRQLCHWWCPRYGDDPGDEAFEQAQAGEHPDGF